MGKIRNPQYRIVIADSRTKRDGRAIEYIGIYQPKEDPSVIQVKSERVQYWLSVGAQPSEAVQRILEKTLDRRACLLTLRAHVAGAVILNRELEVPHTCTLSAADRRLFMMRAIPA
jgi:ribosomal protein S16